MPPVGPVEGEQESKCSDGARVISFSLGPFQASGAEGAGQDERAGMQAAGMRAAGMEPS